jgi:DNA-binding HxlR family transcriptional regulator
MFDPACPSKLAPIRIGDKWTALVLRCLEHGPRRFSELRVPLRRVTSKVLTETLRAMERDGLVTRTVHAGVPLRVEYGLTPIGCSLLGLLDASCAWASEHLEAVMRARAAYEERQDDEVLAGAWTGGGA